MSGLSSATVEAVIKNRRTYYALEKSSPISNERIQEIVKNAVLHVPSSFNFQPVRVVVLFGAEHDKFWEAVKTTLKPLVPDATAWAASEARVNGFKAGYGTVLFFESKKVTEAQQAQFPLYAPKFPIWTTQSDAMHQYAVWLALEADGLGANLQHYNPLVDEFVQKTWGIDPDWELNAQLVFGTPVAGKGPNEKTFQPLEDRVKVFGA
ncbi:putative nitroreductase family protein [Xylogone sp. PMI_703]|nr:putative nitroreductase family protein [Xylogone sp. PMI_703]